MYATANNIPRFQDMKINTFFPRHYWLRSIYWPVICYICYKDALEKYSHIKYFYFVNNDNPAFLCAICQRYNKAGRAGGERESIPVRFFE